MPGSKPLVAFFILFSYLSLSACAVNPVTGKNEFSLVSEQQELAIGAEQYNPSQQSQGGAYSIDHGLDRYINEVGQRLALVSDRALPYEFVVLNNSVPNAWALPGGKIAVNRGLLLELNNEAELAAVLGHEIVHAAARHGAQSMTRGSLLQGAIAIGALASYGSDYADYVVGASQLGSQLITQRYGRNAEREADFYGIQYMILGGYDPRAAISLQETFVRLSEGREQGWSDGLFASHPPSQERVDNNKAQIESLQGEIGRRDLEFGEQRYQQAIALLKQYKPAYDLFDEAQLKVNEDDLETALQKLDDATELVPAEARFTGLKGDILLYQRRYREARSAYDEAIAKDSAYYDYYLGRGVTLARLGSVDLARIDLERSTELLPTAIAMNELGKISLGANDINAAKEYFRTAASAKGTVGEEARQAFIRLDIGDNPASYLQASVFANDDGRIYARVRNLTSLPLKSIKVDFSAVLGGSLGQQSRSINSLGAGQYIDLNSGMRFPEGMVWTQEQMNAVVVKAQVQ